MDKDAALEIIGRFKDVLESKGIRIRNLVLFGSYAAGSQKEGSDIDLIVVSEHFIGKGYWERTEILSDAIYEVFQPIEAIALTPEEWESRESTIAQYAKEGEILYQSE